MKKTIIALILLCSTSSFAQDFNNIKFVRNYDGDTVTVNLNNNIYIFGHKIPEMAYKNEDIFKYEIPVRVFGIDTPEKRGKCKKEKDLGIIAKKITYNILHEANRIDLKNCKRGMYFRIVCDIYADDILLSEELLKKNIAVPYFGKRKTKNWCK